MKKILLIIALMLLSLSSFSQFDPETQLSIEYNNLNQNVKQQQKEIGNTIRSEVEAQARAKRQSTQSTRTNQSSNNQAVQSYNNRISAEGQQRMEYYNNPDNYINRDITNRRSSYFNNERRSTSSQTRDLRTEPIHSENLQSKSLQMLREANMGLFSNEDRAEKANAGVYVQLFEHPNISERPLVEKPNLMQWAWNEHARRMKLQNEVDKTNAMIDMTKKGLGIVGGIATKGALSVGALLSANLNLYAELVKYANECSSGIRKSEGINDTFEILGNTIINTAVDFVAPWIGDEVGATYLGLEYAGTQSWGMLNSVQIGFTLSDFAVNNEKHEE